MAYRKENRRWLGDSKQKYRDYQQQFIKDNYMSMQLRFSKVKDAEICAALTGLANRMEYIRELINADLCGARMIDHYERKSSDGRVWVIDKPAWTETIRHPEEGHWENPADATNQPTTYDTLPHTQVSEPQATGYDTWSRQHTMPMVAEAVDEYNRVNTDAETTTDN